MFFGMVAEKNRLWRSFGSIFTMRLRAWMKPRSSIWSASSRTRNLDGFEGQRATLDEIHEAARRGDEDVDAVGERLLLTGDGDAAEHHGVGEGQVLAVIREALGDLVGEFAGGREHQHAAAAADGLARVLGEAVKDRQREGRGFAGAGLGDAAEVAAFHGGAQGLSLDRGRSLVAGLIQGAQHGLSESENR